MTPDEKPTIVSLDSHRRKRQDDNRKRQAEARKQAKARSSHERAINWRRVPLVLAVAAAFLVLSWLMRQAGGLFH
jgi:hypothetical protein